MMTLADYLTEHLQKPFAWGGNDCVLFAARWVRHASGVDHLAGIPAWSGARQAMRMVRGMGGIKKLLDERLTPIDPHFAQDGDLALYRGRIAIFSGAYIVGPGADGLVSIDRMAAECAWTFSRMGGN